MVSSRWCSSFFSLSSRTRNHGPSSSRKPARYSCANAFNRRIDMGFPTQIGDRQFYWRRCTYDLHRAAGIDDNVGPQQFVPLDHARRRSAAVPPH